MVTAEEFFEHVEQGDTIVAVNEDGHEWEGTVTDINSGSSGDVCLFGEHSLARYYEESELLQLGPDSSAGIGGGIHVPVSQVSNESQGLVWEHPDR